MEWLQCLQYSCLIYSRLIDSITLLINITMNSSVLFPLWFREGKKEVEERTRKKIL